MTMLAAEGIHVARGGRAYLAELMASVRFSSTAASLRLAPALIVRTSTGPALAVFTSLLKREPMAKQGQPSKGMSRLTWPCDVRALLATADAPEQHARFAVVGQRLLGDRHEVQLLQQRVVAELGVDPVHRRRLPSRAPTDAQMWKDTVRPWSCPRLQIPGACGPWWTTWPW